ncbi:MAG: ABC transporter permease [Caldilineaceae bacterium]|nr:ABC transporter permease [Caldilineaceae bacterium]MCB9138141.1 ABC transporter permease [Caldilineaceae bacterium]
MSVTQVSGDRIPPAVESAEAVQLRRKPQTYWSMALSSLRHDKLTLTAMAYILLMVIVTASAGPISRTLVGVGPNDTNPENAFQQSYLGPYIQWRLGTDPMTAPLMLGRSGGVPHWLGTDQLGRDQFVRLLYGGRVSLSVAIVAATISLLLGVTVGTIAGYFGGVVDDVIMWFINTVVSIPTIYLLIIVAAIYSPSPLVLTLFLGFLGWFGTARFMRGNVFRVKALDYTLAARALGARNRRIMWSHIVPNSIPVIVVVTAIDVGVLILTESVLSFLGLGIQPPTATWGNMLNRARNFLFLVDPVTGKPQAIHLLIWPGLLITLTVLAFYLIGDGLRDALDPTLKNKK